MTGKRRVFLAIFTAAVLVNAYQNCGDSTNQKTSEGNGTLSSGGTTGTVPANISVTISKFSDFSHLDAVFSKATDSLYLKVDGAQATMMGCVDFIPPGGTSANNCLPTSKDWTIGAPLAQLSNNTEWKFDGKAFTFSGPTAINVLKNHPYFVPGRYLYYFKNTVTGNYGGGTFQIFP